VNDVNITFINCDGAPHSYSALFPNYAERPPFNYTGPKVFDICGPQTIFSANPSGRVMPAEYYTFVERRGGCGIYAQTATDTGAVGFR